MKKLITYDDLSKLARPCTTERETAEAFISEAQRLDLKPRIGDALYLALSQETPEPRLAFLLDGGEWKDRSGARLLTGVRTALAYYTLARIVRDGNIQPTTYGAVVKDDQYSMDAEKAERQRQYRELFSQADTYMGEVLSYLDCNRDQFPEYTCRTTRRNNRMTIRVIG